MKASNVAALVLLQFALKCALTANVSCGGADLSKLTKVVYVSPQGNDSNSCGQSTTSPCKTIQQGITNCGGEGCGVLVRYGEYTLSKTIDLTDGVSLYGSCIFDETAYKYRSTIVGRPAIKANAINKPTTVYGFVIIAGPFTLSAGEASIAVIVSSSSGLRLSHNLVASGRGGIGGNGSTSTAGTGGSGSSANESTGGAGGKACYFSPPMNIPSRRSPRLVASWIREFLRQPQGQGAYKADVS